MSVNGPLRATALSTDSVEDVERETTLDRSLVDWGKLWKTVSWFYPETAVEVVAFASSLICSVVVGLYNEWRGERQIACRCIEYVLSCLPMSKSVSLALWPPIPCIAESEETMVSIRIACPDGTRFTVSVPEDADISTLRMKIAREQDITRATIELYKGGVEDGLRDREKLRDYLPAQELFMLLRMNNDRTALEELFHSTGGESWTHNAGWCDPTVEIADWWGVHTDGAGRVVRLDLSENNLAGPLPREIGQLTCLKFLYMNSNGLCGPLPGAIGALRALTELGLDGNRLSGAIPREIGQLTASQMWLQHNEFSGPLPAEIGQLTGLTLLNISCNRLSGPLPPEIANMRALRVLNLADNRLSGAVPPEVAAVAQTDGKSVYLMRNPQLVQLVQLAQDDMSDMCCGEL